jgi:uncharacterized protein YpbB
MHPGEVEKRSLLRIPIKTKASKKPKIGKTVVETLKMAEQGLTMEAIAAVRDIAEGTVSQHIEKLLEEGQGDGLDLDRLIDTEKRMLCEELFSRLSGASMRSIIEASGNKVTYADLRLVRAFMTKSETA